MQDKKIFVVDLTGDNARCCACKKTVGKEAVAYMNRWYCSVCRDKAKESSVSPEDQAENQANIKRKLRKKGRTAKGYLRDKFEGNPGVDFAVVSLGKELLQEGLTRQETVAGANQTASVTISLLRKESYPIERVKRGVYRWRPR